MDMNRPKVMAIIICATLLGSLWAQDVKTIRKDTQPGPGFVGYVPNRIVVNLDSATAANINLPQAAAQGLTGIAALDLLAEHYDVASMVAHFPGAEKKIYQGRVVDLRGWFRVTFAGDIEVEQAVDAYRRVPGVLDAQPIGIHSVDIHPNDPQYSMQWHLNQASDVDIDAPEAWDSQTGNSAIIVGVLDTGVRYYHKDLGGSNASPSTPQNSRGNMWINNDELTAGVPNGVDDDGNGYVDDWIGWDFVDDPALPFGYFQMSGEDYDTTDNDPRDFNGHGTHCAGNVAAINNNGYATAAAAGGWGNGTLQPTANGVRVMALRIGYSAYDFFNDREVGFVQMDFAAQALYYAANNGARIVSCSWGSLNNGGIAAAIDYFLASGGLIFKAAGNDSVNNPDYMGGRTDPNLINVAATDTFDRKADFSNFGSWIDISAPGTGIVSSYHWHGDPTGEYIAALNGTSMATPIAASVAALIWSVNPALTADEVRQILYDNADDIDAANPSYIGQLGAGRVNAAKSLSDTPLPVTLTSFSAEAAGGRIVLEWETQSEVNNVGFEILRSFSETGEYRLIASYEDYPSLQGLGNSSIGKKYSFTDQLAVKGLTHWYKLVDVDINGVREEHGPVSVAMESEIISNLTDNTLPERFRLLPNFPNPFNPITRIQFEIPVTSEELLEVRLMVHDLQGRKVKTLFEGSLPPGRFETAWDGSNGNGDAAASGIYVYSLKAGNFRQAGKMMLVR